LLDSQVFDIHGFLHITANSPGRRTGLENLSANPNGQQQKHKAGGDQVGEHDQPRSGKFFGLRMSTQNQTATMKLHAEKNAAMYCM
jgi:hypothetical protein